METPLDACCTRVVSADETGALHDKLAQLLKTALAESASAARWPLDHEIADTLGFASSQPTSVTVIANRSDRLVGALFAERRHLRNAVFVRWIVVHPDDRHAGVGGMLVKHVERATSANEIYGMVDLDDPVAAGFWNGRGWQPMHPRGQRVRMGRSLAGAKPSHRR